MEGNPDHTGAVTGRRRVFFGLLAALVAAGALGVFVATRDDAASGEGGGVVLVHGYGGGPDDLAELADLLRARGRLVRAVTLPDNGFGDIRDSADEVDRAVRALPDGPVDVVGFSLGGVVARSWYARSADRTRARVVVTLAAPHHGTDLAALAGVFGCSGACAQLVPTSSFLRELNRDESPPGPAWVALWTAFDETVVPALSATLDGAVNVRVQDVCADSRVGHSEFARDRLVLGIVLRALDGALAAPPSAADCAPLRATPG